MRSDDRFALSEAGAGRLCLKSAERLKGERRQAEGQSPFGAQLRTRNSFSDF